MTNIAIEHGPVEIVDFPIKNGGSFHSYVNVYQRVIAAWDEPDELHPDYKQSNNPSTFATPPATPRDVTAPVLLVAQLQGICQEFSDGVDDDLKKRLLSGKNVDPIEMKVNKYEQMVR